MTGREQRLQELFFEGSRLEPGELEAFLDRSCGEDESLRAELAALLRPSEVHGERLDALAPRMEVLTETPDRIGKFEILGVLGEGGMGTVYEARQEKPHRTVALKVLRVGVATDSLRRRFEREAEVLARLQHPGIAQVYETGATEGGLPFLTMEHVRGETLDEHARRRELDARARLELLASVTDAVQHAHDHGVIHRDLKPSNVLVDAGGQPKVLDFGIARLTDTEAGATLVTRTGELMGTLAYMSPEQVAGTGTNIDERSDVYALGVVLYELLSGRLPHDIGGLALPEVARVITEEEPRALGVLDPRLRGDVETIVGKALAKELERRYATAAELAADLRRYLRDEPIRARPPSGIYHLRKFAARNRALVGGVVATVLALTAGAVTSGILALWAIESRDDARVEAAASKRAAYRATISAVASALRVNDVAGARRLLDETREEQRGWEWSYFRGRLDQSVAVLRFGEPEKEWSYAEDWVTDRTLFFTADGWIHLFPRSASRGHFVAWNPETGESAVQNLVAPRTRRVPHPSGLRWADYDPESAELSIREARSQEILAKLSITESTLEPMPWQEEDHDPESARFMRRLGGFTFHPAPATSPHLGLAVPGNVCSLGDRAWVEAGGTTWVWRGWGAEELWDHTSGELVGTVPGWHDAYDAVLFGPGFDRLFAFSVSAPRQHFADARLSFEAWREVDSISRVVSADFSPDGATVATGARDGVVRLWDVATGRLTGTFVGHEAGIHAVRFGPDGSRLASAAWDGTLRLWDVAAQGDVDVLSGHDAWVNPVTFSPDGARIVSGAGDGTIRFWDADSGEPIATVRLPAPEGSTKNGVALSLAYMDDGRRIVVTVLDTDPPGHPIVLDSFTGRRIETFPARVMAVAKHPTRIVLDERRSRFLVAQTTAGLGFLDAETYEEVREPLTSCKNAVVALHGDVLATAGARIQDVCLRDADTLEEIATLSGHTNRVQRAVFRPDGSELATCSQDGTACIWRVEDEADLREPVHVLRGHRAEVWALAYSPDGRRIATGSGDRTIRIWDAQSGAELVVLTGHHDYVWSLAFSPDGRRLVSGSGDSTARIWDVDPPQVRVAARREHRALALRFEPVVAALFEELGDAEAVLDRLDADASLSDREREVARQVVLRVGSEG